ncbi:hypothetical protein ABT160_28530 [Streptomyces sp. NPDC001941]|uniref:hypothetical protein n=1 Tax=Streptomyces sp. NPDC001941 TaxID=3154659 RepID=UPI0033186A2A
MAAPFQVRPLATGAERAEACALVQDRIQDLAARGIHLPAAHTYAFRDPSASAIGLYEDDRLRACLILNQQPTPGPGPGPGGTAPCLEITHLYTDPQPDSEHWGRLVSLWAADYAARRHDHTVRITATAGLLDPPEHTERLLTHALTLGWHPGGTSLNPHAQHQRALHLTRPAQPRAGLSAYIRCRVPLALPPAAPRTGHAP